jgi:hypothetical protein
MNKDEVIRHLRIQNGQLMESLSICEAGNIDLKNRIDRWMKYNKKGMKRVKKNFDIIPDPEPDLPFQPQSLIDGRFQAQAHRLLNELGLERIKLQRLQYLVDNGGPAPTGMIQEWMRIEKEKLASEYPDVYASVEKVHGSS